MRATLEVFAHTGWEGLQVDAVAERAGVHKTTIYRRWPTRGALLAAALAATPFRPGGAVIPDTGVVRDDLRMLAAGFDEVLRARRTRKIIRALSEAGAEPELAEVNRSFYEARHQIVSTIVQRGIDRGELPPSTSSGLIATMFMGTIRFHVIDRKVNPTREWFDALVEATVRAAGGPT